MTTTEPVDLSEFGKPARYGPECRVQLIREALDPDDLRKFDAALATKKRTANRVPSRQIMEWVLKRSIPVSLYQIEYHRRGDCMCGKR